MKRQMMLIVAIIALAINSPASATDEICENLQVEINMQIDQGLSESEEWNTYLREFNKRVPDDCTIIGNERRLPRP